MTEQDLMRLAVEMLDKAYVPYSHFPVGAALECEDGTVYTGCNIENAAFPCTICQALHPAPAAAGELRAGVPVTPGPGRT